MGGWSEQGGEASGRRKDGLGIKALTYNEKTGYSRADRLFHTLTWLPNGLSTPLVRKNVKWKSHLKGQRVINTGVERRGTLVMYGGKIGRRGETG